MQYLNDFELEHVDGGLDVPSKTTSLANDLGYYARKLWNAYWSTDTACVAL